MHKPIVMTYHAAWYVWHIVHQSQNSLPACLQVCNTLQGAPYKLPDCACNTMCLRRERRSCILAMAQHSLRLKVQVTYCITVSRSRLCDIQWVLQARQREDVMDLGGHMPTPEEMMNIKQAESMFNVRVTELGSGCVKVLGDIGTLQQVRCLSVCVCVRACVRACSSCATCTMTHWIGF